MEHQAITEKLHSHILRLRRKQQLNGRYRLREYQAIGLTYLCQIENIDTKIVETLLVKHKEII